MKITFNTIITAGLALMFIYLYVTSQLLAAENLLIFMYIWAAWLLLYFIYRALDWDKSISLYVYKQIGNIQFNRAKRNALNQVKKQK